MGGRVDWRERIRALRDLVPDPHAPMVDDAGDLPPQRRVVKQRLCRSVILSRTRRLVAEQGLDNVHMQTVADRSGVSVQTVYNLVGNRQDLISAAATEWVVFMARKAATVAPAHDLNTTFTTMELFWAAAIGQRPYAGNLVHSRAHDGFLQRPFLHTTRLVIASQLRDLRGRGALVRWAEVPTLSDALARAAHNCISGWLDEPYDEGRFHAALVTSCGLLLRGAVAGDEVDRLERGFDGGWTTGTP